MSETDADVPQVDASLIVAWMDAAAEDLAQARQHLTELDAARGDADHGVNMERGFAAIVRQLAESPPGSAGEALMTSSKALRATMGGTSGPLWSSALRRAGKSLGDAHPAPPAALAGALTSAATAVAEMGGAKEGDNTMLDALLPAAQKFEQALQSGGDVKSAAAAAARAATDGAAATSGRVATKGRASYLGKRGIEHADPGAVSAAIVVSALSRVLNAGQPARTA